MGDWKGVRLSPGGPMELFDLAGDIGEANNVADDHPEVIARIGAILDSARTDSPAWPLRGAVGE